MVLRLALVDLDRRIVLLRPRSSLDEESFPHALRGALAGLLADPGWHVVVDLGDEPGPGTQEVLKQAADWAAESRCELTVSHGGQVS